MNIKKYTVYALFIAVAVVVGNPEPSTATAPADSETSALSDIALVAHGQEETTLPNSILVSDSALLAQATPVKEKPVSHPTTPDYSDLNPAMRRICGCESGGGPNNPPRQFEADGVTVRTGRVNPADVGACQINTEPRNGHVVASRKLGFDLWTTKGNIAYANHLYEQEGLTPWNSSKGCWAN